MSTELSNGDEKTGVVTFVPLGEETAISLTIAQVEHFIAKPTKNGELPTKRDIVQFLMLCQARRMNPWVGDAYLVGYDSKDGPQFSLITAHQTLLKRAENNPNYDGMESGVIVGSVDGVDNRRGDFMLDDEKLLGGWARVHRKDQEQPSYDAINLKTFNTGRSRWAKDPAGMIVKVAEASALRKAFPTHLGGLLTSEEMGFTPQATPTRQTPRITRSSLNDTLDVNPAPDAGESTQEAQESPSAGTETATESVDGLFDKGSPTE